MTRRWIASQRALLSRLCADRSTAVSLVLLGGVLVLAMLAPLLPLPAPEQTQLDQRLLPPLSNGHLLGTDHLGRDLLARVLAGTRLSLAVALLGVSVAAGIGSSIGLLSGYYGGRLDGVMMRLIDVLMAFPYLLLALAIVAVLGPGLDHATIAIAIVNVPFFARAVRGQTLSLGREVFVDAARVCGLSDARILWSEMLPGLLSTIVIAASTSMGWMILETAGLSFLGLGSQPPTADLGGMLGQGRHLLTIAPHVSLVPGAFIFCIVALFNVVGDGLRDALDPRYASGARADANDETDAPGLRGPDQTREPGDDGVQVEQALLEVHELSIQFGAVQAVAGVSLALRPGERVAVVGGSGSGKSVTALAILGLLDAPGRRSGGGIWFDGQHLVAPQDWTHVRGGGMAWVPQDPMTSLHPLRRIQSQLCEALKLHGGLRGNEARGRALHLLHEVGIVDAEARLRAYPHELSGGMRQRVVIAMALASEPRLLIADEPTTALDVTTQAKLLETLRQLCDARGMALLFISHDLAVVSQLCQRTLVMTHGRVVEQAATSQIIHEPLHDATRGLVAAVPRLGHPERILLPAAVAVDNGRTPRIRRADSEKLADAVPPVLLEVKRVSKSFVVGTGGMWDRSSTIVAVREASLQVHAGESWGLVGGSGCGKSTLARLVMGLEQPTTGSLAFGGQSYPLEERARRRLISRSVQMVFQDPVSSLNPRKTALDALLAPLDALTSLTHEEQRERAFELLELVELPREFASRYPHELSGGQAQRVSIARALAPKPRLLVLDEALSSLDVSIQARVLQLLHRLRRELELSYLFIGHDLAVVEVVCDHLAVMCQGSLVESGPSAKVLGEPEHPYTRQLLAAVPELAQS